MNKFLTLTGDRRILPQSYRIPRSVHKVALGIVSRIKNRYQKPWSPKTDLGKVEHIADEHQIDFSKGGSWLCMSRSKYSLNRFQQVVRQQGYGYTMNGSGSLDTEETKAITSWERLRKGSRISLHEAKNMVQFLIDRPRLKKKDFYVFDDFHFPSDAKSWDWMRMLRGIAPDEREYLRSCLRNGEKFSDKPRITISTIHQSKGGEADNVALISDMGKLSWQNSHRDEENRVWYVAVTRAKENLFVIRPRSLTYYEL